MRKRTILGVAALVLGGIGMSAAQGQKAGDDEVLRLLGEILPGPGAIERIEVYRKDDEGNLIEKPDVYERQTVFATGDEHCWARVPKRDTYVDDNALYDFAWCKESDYSSSHAIQRDTYLFGSSPLDTERIDDIACMVDNSLVGHWALAPRLPQEAFDKLC